jgi:hypothetical protein
LDWDWGERIFFFFGYAVAFDEVPSRVIAIGAQGIPVLEINADSTLGQL